MMRILLVAGSYPPEPCGVGDYTERLASALATMDGVSVGVLTTSVIQRQRTNASAVELLDMVESWSFSELPSIVRTIRTWMPDLVHVQYPSQGFFSRRLPSLLPLVCRLMGITVIQTWHEPHRMRGLLHFLLQALGANGIVFVRPNYFSMLPATFRRLLERYQTATIPNASALPISTLERAQRLILRDQYIASQKRLIVFFGFVYPSKGIELLFDIANPASDCIIIAGAIKSDMYRDQLANLALSKGWNTEHVRFTGFLSPHDASDLLSIADAVVLPFLDGGGEWNTSIHSALTQGSLVITTADPPRGDEPQRNISTSAPSDTEGMRRALDQLAGRRVAPISPDKQWAEIAEAHLSFYRNCEESVS